MSIVKIPVFGAQPYGFKATDVTGCKGWFDAADVSTLYNQLPVEGMLGFSDYTTANEQRVTVWEDKSDGGNDMIRNVNPENLIDTSAIYMGPPIVAPDSYALLLATVNFPQTDSGGSNSNAPSFLQQNLVAVGAYPYNESARGPRVGTGISATTDIFVVVKPKYLNVAGDVFSIGTRTTDGTQDFTCLSITSSGYWKINSQAAARDVTGDTAEVFNTFSNIRGPDPNYRILHMSLSNNNYVLRRNGSQIGSANRTWSPTLSDYRYYMGRRNASSTPGNYFDGRLGEVIVYNNIITTEKRLIVESYLANKWNLIDLLPSDHPAKSQNTPIYLGGKSMAEEQNGFVRRAVMIKIFVQAPQSPTFNLLLIANAGTTLTSSWFAPGAGGVPDYYSITVLSSTDNITFSAVKYISRYPANLTSFIYTIGSIDNKYYNTQIVARNSGGSSAPVSAFISILNSVPGNPTVNTPSQTGINTLFLSWAANEIGGVPITYNVNLYSSTDNFVSNSLLIYTENGTDELDTTIVGEEASPAITFVFPKKYRSTVQAINGTGSSSIITSSIYSYPEEGT
jgi:hypothetical protein